MDGFLIGDRHWRRSASARLPIASFNSMCHRGMEFGWPKITTQSRHTECRNLVKISGKARNNPKSAPRLETFDALQTGVHVEPSMYSLA